MYAVPPEFPEKRCGGAGPRWSYIRPTLRVGPVPIRSSSAVIVIIIINFKRDRCLPSPQESASAITEPPYQNNNSILIKMQVTEGKLISGRCHSGVVAIDSVPASATKVNNGVTTHSKFQLNDSINGNSLILITYLVSGHRLLSRDGCCRRQDVKG